MKSTHDAHEAADAIKMDAAGEKIPSQSHVVVENHRAYT